MSIRLKLLAGAAAMAAVGGGVAAAGGEDPSVPERPSRADTPAMRPGHVVVKAKPLSSAEIEQQRAERRAAAPDADPRPHFALLRRPARAGDRIPDDQRIGTNARDLDDAGARRGLSNDTGTVHAVPSSGEVCVSTTYLNGRSKGGTDTCVPTETAKRQGAFTITQCSSDEHPQRRFLAGVVPDDVTAVRFTRRGIIVATAEVSDSSFAAEVDDPFDTISLIGNDHSVGIPPVDC